MENDVWTLNEKYTVLVMCANGIKRSRDFSLVEEDIAEVIGKKVGSVKACILNFIYIANEIYPNINSTAGLKGYDKDQEIAVKMYIKLYGKSLFMKL